MVKMNQNEFIKELQKININLTPNQIVTFEKYADLLLEYNQHTNLTAIKTKEEIYLKHFYDSLTLTKIADLQGQLLDIGTGAGFPGLVLAITFPNLNVTLLDSNNKKIKFLEECIRKLNIKNATIAYERAENYVKKNIECFDFVTARAVAQMRILLEIGIPSLKINGQYLIMKGNLTNEEQNDAKHTLEILNSSIVQIIELDLPKNGGHRSLINIIKNKSTNPLYPRSYDKIKKKIL